MDFETALLAQVLERLDQPDFDYYRFDQLYRKYYDSGIEWQYLKSAARSVVYELPFVMLPDIHAWLVVGVDLPIDQESLIAKLLKYEISEQAANYDKYIACLYEANGGRGYPVGHYEHLGVRVFNALQEAGIRDLVELTAMTAEEVLEFRRIGQTSLETIRRVMREHGLSFRDE